MICYRGDEPVFGAEGRPAICPLFDLSKLIDYKYSNALKKMISRSRTLATGTSAAARADLALSSRLHYPRAVGRAAELLDKQTVICRKNVGDRHLTIK
jgi:hypothetical protein